ncbi:hypothetical protein [Spirosoma jeollabukense]
MNLPLANLIATYGPANQQLYLGAGMMNEFVEYRSYADLGRYVSPADFAR